MSGGLWGSIHDVPGVRLGHAQRVGGGWLTGVSVVLPPPGTIGAVDVRGGGPGTRETDALDPSTLVPTVDAVCLAGGSAYGLAAAGGVMAWCEEQGRGVPVGPPSDPSSLVVPIVPAAVVFDLGRGGNPSARPDADLGAAAAAACLVDGPLRGCVGAGTGTVMAERSLKGGVGTASVAVPGVPGAVVGAVAVVNAYGSPVDQATGRLLGEAFVPAGSPRPPRGHASRGRASAGPGLNTTLAVVATNTALDVAQARRAAGAGHDGLARSLSPVHTLVDGDTVFALATGAVPLDGVPAVAAVQAACADAVLLAVLDAVLAATAVATPALDVPAYLEA